jgi:hypothetical protein
MAQQHLEGQCKSQAEHKERHQRHEQQQLEQRHTQQHQEQGATSHQQAAASRRASSAQTHHSCRAIILHTHKKYNTLAAAP